MPLFQSFVYKFVVWLFLLPILGSKYCLTWKKRHSQKYMVLNFGILNNSAFKKAINIFCKFYSLKNIDRSIKICLTWADPEGGTGGPDPLELPDY